MDSTIREGNKAVCSELQMIPNNPGAAEENYKKLTAAINSGKSIKVDNIYYLGCSKETTITKDIIISGANSNACFKLNKGYMLFTPVCQKINLKNVKFENITENAIIIFSYTGSQFMKNVEFSKCTFIGNISLYRHYAPIDIDPSKIKYGINEFTFKDNTVKNTHLSFIVLSDVPHGKVVIKDNMINNFDFVFLDNGVNNDHVYETKLTLSKKSLVCENNHVTCDDTWWNSEKRGSYYTFVLYEGMDCLYQNNYVEGLKSDYDMQVYDAYLSCADLVYKNNTWKNNCSFNSSKKVAVLMKSKSCVETVRGKRVYKNNKFIMEKAFAEKFGRNPEYTWVILYETVCPMDKFDILDNTINVYDLRFPYSTEDILECNFKNNKINCTKVSGSCIYIRMVPEGKYSGRKLVFKENTIIATEYIKDIELNLVKIFDYSGNAKSYSEVRIEDNNISVPLFGYAFWDIHANNLVLKNNDIKVLSSESYPGVGFGSTSIGSQIKNFTNVNNTFEVKNKTFFENRQVVHGLVKEDYVKKDLLEANASSSFRVPNYMVDTRKYNYKREYEISTSKEVFKFNYTFYYYYDKTQDANYIVFTGLDGKTVVTKLQKSPGSNKGENHNTIIKLNGNPGNIYVVFYNDSNDSTVQNMFYLSNLPGENGTTHIKTYMV